MASVRLLAAAVNRGFHITDKLVEVHDTTKYNRDRLFRETRFKRECVSRKDVAGVVHAPIEEGLIAQPEQLARQGQTVPGLVHVDVRAFVMRIDSEANGLLRGNADNDLHAVRIRQSFFHDPDEVKRLLLALPK